MTGVNDPLGLPFPSEAGDYDKPGAIRAITRFRDDQKELLRASDIGGGQEIDRRVAEGG